MVDAGAAVIALTPQAELMVIDPLIDQFKTAAHFKVAESEVYATPVLIGQDSIKDQDWSVAVDGGSVSAAHSHRRAAAHMTLPSLMNDQCSMPNEKYCGRTMGRRACYGCAASVVLESVSRTLPVGCPFRPY